MSWKYPEHPIESGGVVEIDDINRNIGEFAQELDGGLNEHNWEKNSFDRTDCTDDVSIQCWRTKQEQNPTVSFIYYQDEYHRVRSNQGWFPVSTPSQTCSLTITTPGSVLWVMGTLQHIQAANSSATVQYALRIDGVVIPETITGSSSTLDDGVHIASVSGKYNTVFYGSGIWQRYRAVGMDTLVSVEPGTHTVELVTRLTSRDARQDAYFYVGARELVVLSLRN